MAEKLAIDGGKPVNDAPFPMWPQFDPKCHDAVVAILKSGRVGRRSPGVPDRMEEL